jgi:sugar lactone lactonase YvrE
MIRWRPARLIWLAALSIFAVTLFASCRSPVIGERFVRGLNQPRGMSFDRTGNLYVAEAGALTSEETGSVSPIINYSSRVVRITPDGKIDTVVDGLPFTNYVVAGDIGATDVALVGDTLFVLTGEGYDDDLSRAVLRVAPDGSLQVVASIRRYVESIAPADSMMGAGGGLASNPFALVAAPDGQMLYLSDGATGRIFRMTLDGELSLFAEWPGMPPLTGLAFGPDGRLYVALFSELPLAPGKGAIWAVDSTGAPALIISGLTLPIDLGFDASGLMYVLEFSDGGASERLYAPGRGRLLRIGPDGVQTVIRQRLNYPTALVFSPNGDCDIAIHGAFTQPGAGAILKLSCAAPP